MFCIKGQWAALRDGVYSSVCPVGPVSGVFLILHGSVMEMEPPPQPTQGNRHCEEGGTHPVWLHEASLRESSASAPAGKGTQGGYSWSDNPWTGSDTFLPLRELSS